MQNALGGRFVIGSGLNSNPQTPRGSAQFAPYLFWPHQHGLQDTDCRFHTLRCGCARGLTPEAGRTPFPITTKPGMGAGSRFRDWGSYNCRSGVGGFCLGIGGVGGRS